MPHPVKILIVYGTRPEAIKLAPVILAFKSVRDLFQTVVTVTSQHRDLLDPVHTFFGIQPDYDLDIMKYDQTLFDISIQTMSRIRDVLEKEQPDLMMVQGDTSSAFSAALSAVYMKIPVVHVEAGLRTHLKNTPFPEEINRQMIARIADIHFAPAKTAKYNLINEGIPEDRIVVVGNTSVDALFHVLESMRKPEKKQVIINRLLRRLPLKFVEQLRKDRNQTRFILITCHRRENLGKNLEMICHALNQITENLDNTTILFCVHPNPGVSDTVKKFLHNRDTVIISGAFDYPSFIYLMTHASVILTDSGGIQEEAVYLEKQVLLLRNSTERPEALETGWVRLVGLDPTNIVNETLSCLNSNTHINAPAPGRQPYGDGHAAHRIVRYIQDTLPLEKKDWYSLVKIHSAGSYDK